MAQERPNRLGEWVILLRRQMPVVHRHLADWVAACREEPTLIWATPAVRYSTLALIALVSVWSVVKLAEMVAPPLSSSIPVANMGDYHVICSDPDCAHHFVVHRKLGFKKFPVECSRCRKATGAQARRCNSKSCLGRWVAPRKVDGSQRCPRCDRSFD